MGDMQWFSNTVTDSFDDIDSLSFACYKTIVNAVSNPMTVCKLHLIIGTYDMVLHFRTMRDETVC